MNIFKLLKEKNALRKRREILSQAEDFITVSDFGLDLYIAYGGIPLIPIAKDATPDKILDELHSVRDNYIRTKLIEN